MTTMAASSSPTTSVAASLSGRERAVQSARARVGLSAPATSRPATAAAPGGPPLHTFDLPRAGTVVLQPRDSSPPSRAKQLQRRVAVTAARTSPAAEAFATPKTTSAFRVTSGRLSSPTRVRGLGL